MKEGEFKRDEQWRNGRKNYGEASHILARNQITYQNRVTGREQSQNYLEMNDIVVAIMIKRDEKGDLFFAMQPTYIPALNKMFLELPSMSISEEKKAAYNAEEIEQSTDKIAQSLGVEALYKKGMKMNLLSTKSDPVSQSFTDQTARIVEVGVKQVKDNRRLIWVPVSGLRDLLKHNVAMSIQTKYALLLFEEKHRDEIAEDSKYDVKNVFKGLVVSEPEDRKIIWPHKYRFGVAAIKPKVKGFNRDVKKRWHYYGLSNDSVQCVLCRNNNGKIQVGLSKQQRSPFIARDGIEEYFYEIPAGMIDKTDELASISHDEIARKAAIREVKEETGVEIEKDQLVKLSQKLLLSHGTQECSSFFLAKLPEDYEEGEQKLDEQEDISKLEWFDLDELDLDKLHAPLPTKIALLMARNHYERQREKEIQSNEKEIE